VVAIVGAWPPTNVAVPLVRPTMPLALLTNDSDTVLARLPAVAVVAASETLLVVAPLVVAARFEKPVRPTAALFVEPLTLRRSW